MSERFGKFKETIPHWESHALEEGIPVRPPKPWEEAIPVRPPKPWEDAIPVRPSKPWEEGIPVRAPQPWEEGIPVKAFDVEDLLGPFLDLLAWIFAPILFWVILCVACTFAIIRVERVINKIYPAYQTTEERISEFRAILKKGESLTRNAEKRLIFDSSVPVSMTPEGKLVYVDTNGIYSMDFRGRKRRIISVGQPISTYALSPDRKKILFIAGKKLFLVNLTKNQIIQLTKITNSFQLSFSTTDEYGSEDVCWLSDSQILTTVRIHAYSTVILGINLADPESSSAVFLAIPDYLEYGKWVKISNRKGGGLRMFYSCRSPSASPEGTRLVYVKTEMVTHLANPVARSDRIVLKDLQTRKETFYNVGMPVKLTPQAWSPDGSKIVFTTGEKNNIGILRLKKGWFGLTTDVTWLPVCGENPVWSLDGKWIAFENDGEIYVYNIANAKTKTLASNRYGSETKLMLGAVEKVVKGESPSWEMN